MNAEQVFAAARALPEPEQVELIDALITALDDASPRPVDPAVLAEVRRRSAEFDEGKVTPVPWAEVRARLRARLDRG